MVGWMALRAVNIAAEIYLRRFDIATANNPLARKQVTQVRILKGAINTLIITVAVAAALMTIDAVRQFGVNLFASAGIAGIIVGLAARPMLSNLIADLQLAITQPIRLDDAIRSSASAPRQKRSCAHRNSGTEIFNVQITDADHRSMEMRLQASAAVPARRSTCVASSAKS
jgi:small-conductance mechanosensitive channel